MQLLHNSYRWQMKAMTVVPMKIYQHPYAKCHAYTMYPAWNMHLSTLHTAHPADQLQSASDITYTPTRPVHCCLSFSSDSDPGTLQIVPVIQPQNPLTLRTRISRQYLWTMNIGQKK